MQAANVLRAHADAGKGRLKPRPHLTGAEPLQTQGGQGALAAQARQPAVELAAGITALCPGGAGHQDHFVLERAGEVGEELEVEGRGPLQVVDRQ